MFSWVLTFSFRVGESTALPVSVTWCPSYVVVTNELSTFDASYSHLFLDLFVWHDLRARYSCIYVASSLLLHVPSIRHRVPEPYSNDGVISIVFTTSCILRLRKIAFKHPTAPTSLVLCNCYQCCLLCCPCSNKQ